MKVLLDACVPQWLRKEVVDVDVETAGYAGLDHLSDSALLAAIEERYDVLVTLDRNMAYQQKIAGQQISVVVIRVTEQTPDGFRTLVPELNEAIRTATPGRVQVVGP